VTKTRQLRSEVMRFRSGLDGSEQAAGLCGPSATASELLPLLVELEPGSIFDLERTLEDGRRYLTMIDEPAVWLRPGGRGPGTVFQGYGEVDVLEAIEAAKDRYPIDQDRVSLFGFSMGGAGVWYLGSHLADRFSAIAPLGGYNDFRLWRRPGGMTFPLQPWEVPSWESRSAAFHFENLRHVGVWMVHGGWDRAVGGGVDVEHSRRAATALERLGIPYKYTELRDIGHDFRFMSEPLFADVLKWLVTQQRPAEPAVVSLSTGELRHARAYWLQVEQQDHYGTVSTVMAECPGEPMVLRTENVRRLRLTPPQRPHHKRELLVDGTSLVVSPDEHDLVLFRDDGGGWALAVDTPRAEKRPHLSGPFGDLFYAKTQLVTGTAGGAEESFFNNWCARDAASFFKQWNGGVHRGGIPGENWVDLEVITDVEWLSQSGSASETGRNVIAYGTPRTNKLLAEVAEETAVWAEPGMVRIGERDIRGEGLGLIAVVPFPSGVPGYLAVHSGTSPDASTAGAHLNWQLLPDYLVYDCERVREWGFFDNRWGAVPAGEG
jgi:predicted esterase